VIKNAVRVMQIATDQIEECRGHRHGQGPGRAAHRRHHPHPPRPAGMNGLPGRRSTGADEAVLRLLESTPALKQSEIARALSAPQNSTRKRLARLQRKQLVTRGEGGRWCLTPAPAEPWVKPINTYCRRSSGAGDASRFG
jgi:hypothetical protein